jgi:hypothetical protein
MIPEAKGGTSEMITVGKDEREKMVKYGTLIVGTVCDKHGSKLGCTKLHTAFSSFAKDEVRLVQLVPFDPIQEGCDGT